MLLALGLVPEQQQLPPTPGTPPRHAEVRAVNVHLPVAEDIPEPVRADLPHGLVLDGVDEPRRQREPFCEVVDEEAWQGVDERQDQSRFFRHRRGVSGGVR